jgi:hypothetical protein
MTQWVATKDENGMSLSRFTHSPTHRFTIFHIKGGSIMPFTNKRRHLVDWVLPLACFIAVTGFVPGSEAATTSAKFPQSSFGSPEDAVSALIYAVRNNDTRDLELIFGSEAKALLESGDEIDDAQARAHFLKSYEDKHYLEKDGNERAMLVVGEHGWSFPIPMVREGDRWRFDAAQGREEIFNRRIGQNELFAIKTCLAYVDAQLEYASEDRTGDGVLQYAQKFASTPGRKDGLYWETAPGEEPSPLGPLAAAARSEGYTRAREKSSPTPYHGYYYRILNAQGPKAPGGAYNYVTRGKMIGGFALAAHPAKYGVSGIMTFLVNHEGIVYEKDLGKSTAKIVADMKIFNPDKTWRKVESP